MRAAVCRAFGEPLEIEDVELSAPRPGQVEVEISACAVCHSDIHYMDGAWGGDLPAVYGHEAAGWVRSLGQGVAGLAEGDPALVTLIRSCGSCPCCSSGFPANCEVPREPLERSPLRDMTGKPIQQGLQAGAFAERVVVDASQVQRLPGDIALDVACLLACGVITGFGAAINTARVKPGSDVVVIGAGGVGLNSIQGAAIAGAARIVAVDMLPEKLEGAREFGATHVVNATDGDAHRQVRKLTGGRGADYVFVTVGAAAAYGQAPRFLAPKGELVAVGMTESDVVAEWSPLIYAFQGQSIRGSCMGDTVLPRDIPYLVELYRQGRLRLDELVSNRFPLERINEAIADARSGRSRRNVIVFDGAGP